MKHAFPRGVSRWTDRFRMALGVVAVAGLAGVGCEHPDVFRNVSPKQKHAVFTTGNPPGFAGFFGIGGAVAPRAINGHPTAFWRIHDRFRIPPGVTVIETIGANEPYSYEPMRFQAQAGCRYILRPSRTNDRDAAILIERSPRTRSERVVSTVLRVPD